MIQKDINIIQTSIQKVSIFLLTYPGQVEVVPNMKYYILSQNYPVKYLQEVGNIRILSA